MEFRQIDYAVVAMSHYSEPATIHRASPEQRAAALAMLHLGTTQIQRMLQSSQNQSFDFGGLYVARRGTKIVGAAWGQQVRGKTAFCWPPCLVSGEPEETAMHLQKAVDRFLDKSRTIVTQAVLSASSETEVERLKQAGYRYLTDLAYMVAAADQFPQQPPADELSWLPITADKMNLFAELVEQTYRGSLDCAELDGVRNIDDVLEGYRATGEYTPAWWLRVRQGDSDVGCLVLADYPEYQQAELVYLGIVPAARGRGLGSRLARYAQWLAGNRGRQQLVLAVDSSNWPARRIYEATGFKLWDYRSIFVRTLETT